MQNFQGESRSILVDTGLFILVQGVGLMNPLVTSHILVVAGYVLGSFFLGGSSVELTKIPKKTSTRSASSVD